MKTPQSILFLAFPNVGEQDLFAAWELMRATALTLSYQNQTLDVAIGSFEGGMLQTHMGAHVDSQRTITAADRFDVLYVPGGIGAGAASRDPRVLELIRAHHAEGRWVAANCAGVGVLHRAGILDGREITSPASLSRRLPALGANLMSPRRAWKVDADKRLFTSGGAATVHPGTIALVRALLGEQVARGLARSWDTEALHGEALYSDIGPVMNDDAVATKALQDQLEMVFLPD